MNLNQLKYFIAAAENRSFTKAATQFYISQTAVTQQIKALEEVLGVPLFDRTMRPIALTPEGQTFLLEAKKILNEINHAVSMVQEVSVGLTGNLKIGYVKGYEFGKLASIIKQFKEHFPNIFVSYYRCDTDTLATGLVNGEYDLIFTWDSSELSRDCCINNLTIEESRLNVVMCKEHPLAKKQSIRRLDLKDENILYMTHSKDGNSIGDRRFKDLYYKSGFKPNVLFNSNDMESILMMISAGEGISIFPEYISEKQNCLSNLVSVPLYGENESVEIKALWHTENNNPAFWKFIEHLKNLSFM